MSLLGTTKSYGLDGINLKVESFGVNEIYQITPNDDEKDSDWQDATVCPSVPGRSVCMPPDEYLRKRQAEIENPQLKEAYLRCNDRCSEANTGSILAATGIGIVMGMVLISLVNGRISLNESFLSPLPELGHLKSSGVILRSF